MKTTNNLTIAGGTGFLGQVLIEQLQGSFDTIYVLTRKFRPDYENVKYIQWDGLTLGDWQQTIDHSNTVINLSGKSVDCRYTQKNKIAILASRVNTTRALGKAILLSKTPPTLWINSSTATIYKDEKQKLMDEFTGEIGHNFSENVAQNWEQAFFDCYKRGVRQVALRTSIVLGKKGGALLPLKNLVKSGFGGKQGDGEQKVSWIHEQDFARSVQFIIENEHIEGVINLVAPTPVTNKKFMKSLRETLQVSFGLPLPRPLLEIGAKLIKTETELILKSRNVIPDRLLQQGFRFRFPRVELALKDLLTS
ncbi:MAG: TIGR01777 family oxidoreductase [Gilvibacter sp.]